jgi:DNA-binding CsgD family transcriptional regulator
MSFWHRLLYRLGLRADPGPRYYRLDGDLQVSLAALAGHEGRSEQELAADLLAAGLTHYHAGDELWQRWQSLSPREQDVAALACLGYTNKQIAARLGISPETVKSHLGNGLAKFGLHSRAELRLSLDGWDFSAWE